jgi:ferredoxin
VGWKVFVEHETCEGHACCVMAVPSVFDLDDDTGKAVVLVAEPTDSLRRSVEDAERGCPVRAIVIEAS